MKLLVDNQLPRRLCSFLISLGDDCQHVLDVGLDEASDLEVWNHALSEQRVLVSKDEDFVSLANRPGDVGKMIWVRLGNCRNDALIAAFTRIHTR